MQTPYDVIVVGGGTAGVVAAIQAGRAGARTLLVEKNGILGGTITIAGINAPAHFFAWGRQVIGGIGWELVRRTLEETGETVSETADFPLIDKSIFAALCDTAVLEAGVEVLLHAMPAVVTRAEDAWTLTVCTKLGLRTFNTLVLIDATGDANLVELAGFNVIRPDITQPATLQMECTGYDPNTLDYPALAKAAELAVAAGELKNTDVSWYGSDPEAFLRRYGRNANHLRAPRAETSEGRSAAEIEARQAMLRMFRFFRKQPGLEQFRVASSCAEVGIRETITIAGKATISVADYEAGMVYDDAVCYAFYPIDEHLNDGLGINWRQLNAQVLPTIPRGALLPAGSRFLIAAGRCVSSDRLANSALRVECPCMAMGQAAGAMAALSARTGLDPEALALEDVRDLLREHGAIVPEMQSLARVSL